MAEWTEAPEVAEVASKLIDEYHSHLVEAKIAYLFREGPWSSQDRTTWGKAYKVSGRDNFLTGYDFYLVINREVWHALDEASRTALIDHELMHCSRGDDDKNGNPVWSMRGHGLEDFNAVVRRHGMWNEAVKRYLAAAEKRDQDDGQVNLLELIEQPERAVDGVVQ